MDRRVLLSATVAFALTVGCTSAGAAPQAVTVPAPCPGDPPVCNDGSATDKTKDKVVAISVAKDGRVGFPCFKVRKGRTKIMWFGESGVEDLLISFKRCSDADPAPPDSPDCKDAVCVLEKAKHKDTEGKLCYTVVVVRDDKTVFVCDPQLIIKP